MHKKVKKPEDLKTSGLVWVPSLTELKVANSNYLLRDINGKKALHMSWLAVGKTDYEWHF